MTISKRGPSRTYRFREIADTLQEMIASGAVAAGDRLPAERQLAIACRASRASVREALRMLQEQGVVEIRRGVKGGAYVKSPDIRPFGNQLDRLLRLERLSLDQIATFREAIEVGVTTQAAGVAGPQDIRMLKQRLESVRACMAAGDVEAFIEADKRVHLGIAQIAGNPLFNQSLQAALGMKRYFHRFLGIHPSFMESNYQDLSDIIRAMETHQAARAGRITQSHITHFNRSVA